MPRLAETDPLVTARILRGLESDSLCVKVSHSACDAGGLKEYAALLAKVYGSILEGKECPLEPNLRGRRDQQPLFQNTKDPGSVVFKGFAKPTWAFPQEEGPERLHTFRCIPPSQFSPVKSLARTKNATVNDVLLTALFRTYFNLNKTPPAEPMTIQVSIDLRRHLPGRRAEAICNLSGSLYAVLDRRTGEAFNDALGRVSAVMNEIKSDYPGVEMAAALEYLVRSGFTELEKLSARSAEMSKKHNVTFPLLSNFGILPDYCFGGLYATKGYITSPIMYAPGFMLGATTFRDELTLSLGYCGQKNQKRVNDFFDAYLGELPP